MVEAPVPASGSLRDNFRVYLPHRTAEVVRRSQQLLVRTTTPGAGLLSAVREAARAEAPDAAILELHTLAAMEEEERFTIWGAMMLFISAGLIILLLSALGLYAVVAFAVGQRTREIAVRMAIGARARKIVREFAEEGLRLSLFGVATGLPLSLLGLRVMLSQTPDVPAVSVPYVTLLVGGSILAVSAVASVIPASRAAGVNPADILRRD